MGLFDPIDRELGEHFHICETCGNEHGFHVTFKKNGDEHKGILVCPNEVNNTKLVEDFIKPMIFSRVNLSNQ